MTQPLEDFATTLLGRLLGLIMSHEIVHSLLAFDIPAGQAAAYYPEANPLVPLQSVGAGSFTPTSKYVAIRLQAHHAEARIL